MAKIFIVGGENDRHIDEPIFKHGHDLARFDGNGDIITKLFESKPDIIIQDVPKGDSTPYRQLQEWRRLPQFAGIPVLMMVEDSEDEVNRAISSGANEYVIKPVRVTELITRIGLLVNRVSMFSDEFAPGTVFANRYKIVKLLGKGGDSKVYRALDVSTNYNVALKVLKVKTDKEEFSWQFERETTQLARLDHPSIVKLLDHGCHEGMFYVVTEFVKGCSLGDVIKQSPVIQESAVDLGILMADALRYINQFGIVHRDIKPDNILISDEGEVKIVDFGLARNEDQQTVSIKGEMFGTPQYLAPEYIDGKRLTIKTDIYSLGVTLFYMVTGTLPFQAGTPMALLSKQLNEAPPKLCLHYSYISEEFSDVVDSMLAKAPENRISIEDLIYRLKKLQDPRGEEEIETPREDTGTDERSTYEDAAENAEPSDSANGENSVQKAKDHIAEQEKSGEKTAVPDTEQKNEQLDATKLEEPVVAKTPKSKKRKKKRKRKRTAAS